MLSNIKLSETIAKNNRLWPKGSTSYKNKKENSDTATDVVNKFQMPGLQLCKGVDLI